MKLTRRHFLAAAAATATAAATSRSAGQPLGNVFRPEDFGARGDGRSNDSAAFAALAEQVNRAGGGIVELRRATYLVGGQVRTAEGQRFAFQPARLLEFARCGRPLIIRGNGATLKCADRLRFGTFDRRSGAAVRHRQPYYGPGELASPYPWMIRVDDCAAAVEIADLELDGNVGRLVVGGPWGDIGHQIAAGGIGLFNNRGPELVSNVHTHHHAQDGLLIDGVDRDRARRSRIENVRSEYNGRQGCSLIGGRGYDFAGCHFNHTGRGAVTSAPTAGVDIEAENNKQVRDLTFSDCEFSDNGGPAMVADNGDSEQVLFTDCSFVGTTAWAAWPNRPGFRFERCRFVGPVTRAHGDTRRPELATQFLSCTFRDDPSLSPGGRVFTGANPRAPIADLPANPNVLFGDCRFELSHGATLPWTTDVIYRDCDMSQRSSAPSYPRGTWRGRNVIRGRAILSGSRVEGEVILNGVPLPRGSVT